MFPVRVVIVEPQLTGELGLKIEALKKQTHIFKKKAKTIMTGVSLH